MKFDPRVVSISHTIFYGPSFWFIEDVLSLDNFSLFRLPWSMAHRILSQVIESPHNTPLNLKYFLSVVGIPIYDL